MNALKPGELWRRDGQISSHIADVVGGEAFQRMAVYAIAEYASDVASQPDAGQRIQGAKDILTKMMNIGSEPKKRKPLSFNLPGEER